MPRTAGRPSSSSRFHAEQMAIDQASVKRELRKSIIAKRDMLPGAVRAAMSLVITNKITGLDRYRMAEVVLAYMNFGSEFETEGFVRQVLEDGKALLLPKLRNDRSGLDLHFVTDLEDGLEAGTWGIREPRGGDSIEDFSLIDFILVPGVAFSRSGARLGYGGGFYDRLLVNKRSDAASIVAAFSLQMVDEIPLEGNDIPVDAIITEAGEYFRNGTIS